MSDILENRMIWINALLNPNTRKGKNRLDDGNLRCTLGIGCEALGLPVYHRSGSKKGQPVYLYGNEEFVAPKTFIEMVGLKDEKGTIGTKVAKFRNYETLIEINDLTNASAKKIGEYMLSVVKGGHGSPFVEV